MPTHNLSASQSRVARLRRRALFTSLPFLTPLFLAPVVTGVVAATFERDAQAQITFGGSASGSGASTPAAPPASSAPPAANAPAQPAPAVATIEASTPADDNEDAALAATPDSEAEWRERDRLLGESAALSGGVGLLHMQHAQSGAPGQFRLGFTTEYFSAGFLCTNSFPCQDPRSTGKVTSDSLDHIGGTISLTATLTNWLEAYAATGAFANSDNQNRPSLLQVLGDTDFGLKAFGKIGRWFNLGGAMELWLINGTGAVGLDGSGTGAKFRGLATADLRGLEKSVPLRFSFNGTYSVDNTGDVVAPTEVARGTSVTRIERYGLQVNRVDHFDIGIGAEFFAAEDRVRPFIEYNVLVPVNRQGYLCKTTNISGDNCLANDAIAPSKLTIGGRFLPWKHGFNVLAALDIGVTGVGDFIEEVAPQAPWTLYIGAGWAIDTWDRPPVVQMKQVEKIVEMRPVPRGHVKGLVHEQVKEGAKSDAIANAIVAFDGHPEITSLATGPDGRFLTQELPEGTWAFTVRADGYKDGKCSGTLVKTTATASTTPATTTSGGSKDAPAPTAPVTAPTGDSRGVVNDVQIDCALEALPRTGRVVGHVRDADNQASIAGATVTLTDSNRKETSFTADSNGAFHFDGIAPGNVTLSAESDGFMNQVQTTDVKARSDSNSDITLHKRPKNPLVMVTAKEITIKQQIQFATDSAVILPASDGLLTEIADVFIHNPRIHRVEIQGHTDSEGADDHNQILSDDRASSVRTWLIQHGVAADRLVAKGYGEKKPLAPNVTAANRARNRRVQFVILEQDAAVPAAPAAATPAAGAPSLPKPAPLPKAP